MKIRLQKPSDQPTGAWRLLDDLEQVLTTPAYTELRLIVAFAKAGPLLKLQAAFKAFRDRGGRIEAIIGVDAGGTSVEALELALQCFDNTFVARANLRFQATFHPKIYYARGPHKAIAFIGSNNLTVGGTELNPEALVELAFDLPREASELGIVLAAWDDALAFSVKLNSTILQRLSADNVVGSETAERAVRLARGTLPRSQVASQPFPRIAAQPPRALPAPRGALARAKRAKGKKKIVSTGVGLSLVLEVLPHHNGEVFLSKSAVDQDPEFFGWPFTGNTTPKREGNPAYPQRDPDPIVSIEVLDSSGLQVAYHNAHPLNTVYYSLKSEVRITVPPDVIASTPDYSILQMSIPARGGGLDYELSFFAPGSEEHASLLAACNQKMPSGGKPRARRFGWL